MVQGVGARVERTVTGGSTAAAVLVHGFAGTRESMRPLAEGLRAGGVRAEVPLLPGHESAWEDLGRVAWSDWTDAVDDAVTVASATGPVTVAGLSMGGALALRAAATRPEVYRVVVINPSLTVRNPLLPLVPLLKYAVRSVDNDGRQVLDPEVDYRGNERIPLAAVQQLRGLWRDVRSRLGDVHQSLLVFRSLADGEGGRRNTQIVLDGVASATSEVVVLHRSGHVATLDRELPLIVDRVVEMASSTVLPARPTTRRRRTHD
jgi:carboxylesterase